MSAKPVQISIDSDLLRRIDDDPEVRAKGRSAFVRSAVEAYLSVKQRREIEAQLVKAYSGQAEAMYDEVAELLGDQSWPNE